MDIRRIFPSLLILLFIATFSFVVGCSKDEKEPTAESPIPASGSPAATGSAAPAPPSAVRIDRAKGPVLPESVLGVVGLKSLSSVTSFTAGTANRPARQASGEGFDRPAGRLYSGSTPGTTEWRQWTNPISTH